MNKQVQNSNQKDRKLTNQIKENLEYREFLNRLGIDPSDFDDPFEIEIDDYSR